MKHLMWVVLGWLGLACLPLSAHAQAVVPPYGLPAGIACAYNTSPPTVTNGQVVWVQCDSSGKLITSASSGGASNATIVGPLGPSQAPAAAVSVVEPDDKNVCDGVINTCTASGATTLFTQDTQGYSSISVQVTADASGNTIAFEQSEDNTTWYPTAGIYSGWSGINPPATTTNVLSLFSFSKKGRYFRARVSNQVGGTTTVVAYLHKSAKSDPTTPINLQAGTAAIGKVGPGFTSAQTPISGNSTGTTGAVVGTLAAASSKFTYICGFSVSATGGVATLGPITIAGTVTASQVYQLFSTATGANLSVNFNICIPSSAVNTPITITTTADATASAVDVNSWGYQE